jgi:hypothetical protein
MRRVWVVGFAVAMMLVLAGCPTPPPAGYRPPVLESIDVTPSTVAPGETMVAVLDVRDDIGIVGPVVRTLTTPSGSRLTGRDHCSSDMTPVEGVTHVLVTVTCTVPTFASNGTWRLEMLIHDSTPPVLQPGLTTQVRFDVAGGTEDRRGPELVSHSIEPAVVDQETTFVLSARLRDDALPIAVGQARDGRIYFAKLFAQNSVFNCKDPLYTPVSATEVDVTVSCAPSNYYVPGRSEPGVHLGRVVMIDALNQESFNDIVIDVQPAPGA